MILPDELRIALEAALSQRSGKPVRVISGRALSGGCIHRALEVTTSEQPVFLKWNRGWDAAGFGAEARGLDALRDALQVQSQIRIPAIIGWHDADRGGDALGWLALEYLPPSTAGSSYDRALGQGLALLHRTHGDQWGWSETNRIGPLAQSNQTHETWALFWAHERLKPQIDRARDGNALAPGDLDLLERVLDTAAEVLADVEDEGPSLVHGDLWSGNVHAGPDGYPVLVDPAVYFGHREVDLAMAELFGGFPDRALACYRDEWPLTDGYEDVRRPLYQLYYLLAHLNLFGPGYLPGVRRAAGQVVRHQSA